MTGHKIRLRVKVANVDRFIRKNARLIADCICFTPAVIGGLLYVGGANYIQENDIVGGLLIITCGLIFMQVAKKVYNYFYGGTRK